MDINSKSNKSKKSGKLIVNTTVIILILTSAIGMMLSYINIEKYNEEYGYNIFEEWKFAETINLSNHVLYYELYSSRDSISPADILVDSNYYWGERNEGDNEEINNVEIDNIKEIFNSTIKEELYYLSNGDKGIEYIAINNDINKLTSSFEDLEIINEDKEIDLSLVNEDDYKFYVVIEFNSEGNWNIEEIYGADKERLEEVLLNIHMHIAGVSSEGLNQIKNTVYFYGVKDGLGQDTGVITWDMANMEFNKYIPPTVIIMLILAGILTLIILVLPYNKFKNTLGFKAVSKVPFEIIVLLMGGIIAGVIFAQVYLVRGSIEGVIIDYTGAILLREILTLEVINLLNFLMWIVYSTTIIYSILIIKQIFSKGIGKYIKENTLLGIIIMFFIKRIKKVISSIVSIDFNDNNNKNILKLVTINGVIISLFTAIWFFGIIGVIIYSVVLFILIKRYYEEIKRKYNILKAATEKIAEGILDIKIDEDLGVLEPVKNDIEKIQGGFKKAVEEEVKSQKLKTDLISNISHDLKTPLTSIITYVDLLKDESLTQEKRAQYLDTLDRKSQRLQTLIEDLFEMSKVSSRSIKLNYEDIDVLSLVNQTIFELGDNIEEANLTVRKNLPQEKIILKLDSQRTFRVFENLILNITKYSMKNTRVYIDVINSENEVTISFKNIAAEEILFDVETIADRFVRGDESRNTEGSGLGLAIAKSFVEIQGGDFKIEVDGDLFKVEIVFKK